MNIYIYELSIAREPDGAYNHDMSWRQTASGHILISENVQN